MLTRFVSGQPSYNLLLREVERELIPLAQEEGPAAITTLLLPGRAFHPGGPHSLKRGASFFQGRQLRTAYFASPARRA